MTNRRTFGSVRRLPSGRWQATYWHAGRRRFGPATFATKTDAGAYLSSVETEIRRGHWLDPAGGRMRFAEWVDC